MFWFCSGVSEGLATCLERMGVKVKGQVIPNSELGLPVGYEEGLTAESDESEGESDNSSTHTEDSDHCSSSFSDEEDEQGESHWASYNIEVLNRLNLNSSPENSDHIPSPCSDRDSETNLETFEPQVEYVTSCDDSVSHSGRSSRTGHSQGREQSAQVSVVHEDVKNRSDSNEAMIMRINLDVTAMIAYVSSTTNGGCHFTFEDKFLAQQAKCEQQSPVRKVLDSAFEGKQESGILLNNSSEITADLAAVDIS